MKKITHPEVYKQATSLGFNLTKEECDEIVSSLNTIISTKNLAIANGLLNLESSVGKEIRSANTDLLRPYQLDYKTCTDLGFVDTDLRDSIFEEERGYRSFTLTKDLTSKLYLSWDQNTRVVTLVRCKGSDILSTILIKSKASLIDTIKFYSEKSSEIIGLPRKPGSIEYLAC